MRDMAEHKPSAVLSDQSWYGFVKSINLEFWSHWKIFLRWQENIVTHIYSSLLGCYQKTAFQVLILMIRINSITGSPRNGRMSGLQGTWIMDTGYCRNKQEMLGNWRSVQALTECGRTLSQVRIFSHFCNGRHSLCQNLYIIFVESATQ